MENNNKGWTTKIIIGAICVLSIAGGILLWKATTSKDGDDATTLSEVSLNSTEENTDDTLTMDDVLETAPEGSEDKVYAALEKNEEELANNGISLEEAKSAEIKMTESGNYIIVIGDKNIFINTIDNLFYIENNEDFFGTGNEGAETEELYLNVYQTIENNPDVLYAANVGIDDLWEEVCNGDYGIQPTSEADIYTIKWNNTIITVDVGNNTASVNE